MEGILHVFGLCHDTHTHLDVLDILLYSFFGGIPVFAYIKYRFKRLFNKKEK